MGISWAVGFSPPEQLRSPPMLLVVCSSRNAHVRLPLIKGRKLFKQAILTVQSLKQARGNREELQEVLRTEVSRLLKADMLQVLGELHRQDECTLAYEVFKLARKEMWYKPDPLLYRRMIYTLGGNRRIGDAERIFEELQGEMVPDPSVYHELIRAYFRCHRPLDAIQCYDEMKQLGMGVRLSTFMMLIDGLEKRGLADKACEIRADRDEVLRGKKQSKKSNMIN